uniref:Methionine gamma-lyase n=1 Tax=Aegilops tauschii subsp. strangulata TaxID=200361 RepID=A0A452YMP0_AEGTS
RLAALPTPDYLPDPEFLIIGYKLAPSPARFPTPLLIDLALSSLQKHPVIRPTIPMAHVLAAAEPLTLLKRPPPQNDGFGDDNGSTEEKAPKARRRESDPAAALAAARHEFGEHGGVNMSIEASATFTVMEPDTMRRLFTGELGPERGDLYIYSRHFNPTVLALGRQMAALEGTEAAYCTASGMSAISCVLMQLVGAGGHVVASRCLYGGTHALLSRFLPRTSGVQATFVDADDEAAVRAAIRPGETRVVYVETMSNPTLAVADIPMLARVAHEAGAKLVVDNTFTPVVVSPARLGADVVVHSVSKFISGGADIIAGKDAHIPELLPGYVACSMHACKDKKGQQLLLTTIHVCWLKVPRMQAYLPNLKVRQSPYVLPSFLFWIATTPRF